MANSPHDILNNILLLNFPDHILIKKPFSMFKKRSRFSSLLHQFFFAIGAFLTIIKHPGEKYVFREYDAFSVLFLLFYKRKIVFNVNHNLKCKSGRVVTKLLSFFHQVVFIDASPDVIEKFPYLLKISSDFKTPRVFNWDDLHVLLICGSRQDQRSFSEKSLLDLTNSLKRSGYIVTAVGKNHPEGKWLTDDEYNASVETSACICLSTYSDRHAGTLWYLKQRAPVLLFRETNVAMEQVKGHEFSFGFTKLEEISGCLSSASFLLRSGNMSEGCAL